MSRERITRRNLPHWYVPGAMHFVTFRLAGTLPRQVIDDLKQRRRELLLGRADGISALEHRRRVHKQLFAAYDRYLDLNREIAWLADPRIASVMRASLYHLHGKHYALLAYSIMPNHVHVLFQPLIAEQEFAEDSESDTGEDADRHGPLASIMHSLKGYTAHQANQILRRKGAFWQHESYDHWVRDEDELERIVDYIESMQSMRGSPSGRPIGVGARLTIAF